LIRVPAMIALLRDIRTDRPTGSHRTRLSPDGVKLDRRMLGQSAGSAVKLDCDEIVTNGLHVAEGLETGLAARAIGLRPVWSLGSAGSVAAFPVLSGINSLASCDGASWRYN
jgi:putative DNA primase/helicase